jgi:U3 small nucleolar RNA-associated protein 3
VSAVHLILYTTLNSAGSLEQEPVPVAPQSLPQDKRSIIRHLEKNNPEALALARDWEDTAFNLIRTKQKLAK